MPADPTIHPAEGPRPLVLGPPGADLVIVTVDDLPVAAWDRRVAEALHGGVPIALWGLVGERFRGAAALGPAVLGRSVTSTDPIDLLSDVRHALDVGTTAGSEGAAGSGPMVVLTSELDPDAPIEAASWLLAAGVEPARLAVEIPIGAGPGSRTDARAEARALDRLTSAVGLGMRAGIVLTTRPDEDEDHVSGWEIGVLTAGLLAGASLVRGVELRRARRVIEVVAALEDPALTGAGSGA